MNHRLRNEPNSILIKRCCSKGMRIYITNSIKVPVRVTGQALFLCVYLFTRLTNSFTIVSAASELSLFAIRARYSSRSA